VHAQRGPVDAGHPQIGGNLRRAAAVAEHFDVDRDLAGEVGEVPVAGGRIKLLTDSKWSLTQTDANTGATNYHHGGTWALRGNEYAETVEYASANTTNLVNHTFKFKIKVAGDTLTLIGIGNPWKEVWKRAKSEALKPLKSDSIPQGEWLGKEKGAAATGSRPCAGRDLTPTRQSCWFDVAMLFGSPLSPARGRGSILEGAETQQNCGEAQFGLPRA
jgi:hypothetical protein